MISSEIVNAFWQQVPAGVVECLRGDGSMRFFPNATPAQQAQARQLIANLQANPPAPAPDPKTQFAALKDDPSRIQFLAQQLGLI